MWTTGKRPACDQQVKSDRFDRLFMIGNVCTASSWACPNQKLYKITELVTHIWWTMLRLVYHDQVFVNRCPPRNQVICMRCQSKDSASKYVIVIWLPKFAHWNDTSHLKQVKDCTVESNAKLCLEACVDGRVKLCCTGWLSVVMYCTICAMQVHWACESHIVWANPEMLWQSIWV